MTTAEAGASPNTRPKGLRPVRAVERMVLVYDEPSTRLVELTQSLQGLVAVECVLYSTTYGQATKRMGWQRFEQQLGVPLEYLDDKQLGALGTRLGRPLERPCVLAELADGSLVELLSAGAIASASGSPEDLKGRLWLHASSKDLGIPYAVDPPPTE